MCEVSTIPLEARGRYIEKGKILNNFKTRDIIYYSRVPIHDDMVLSGYITLLKLLVLFSDLLSRSFGGLSPFRRIFQWRFDPGFNFRWK